LKFTICTFIAFFLLASILVFGVWSNIQVYAQSPTTGDLASKSISPELKSIMCDPSNPDLKVVNTTEARVCGIPKTVKPSLSAATEISTVSSVSSPSSSSPPAQQTATTGAKPTTPTSMTIPPKPQQTVKKINAISPSTVYVTWATISLLSNTSSLPSSTIAPQIAALSQQQQSQLIPIARVNSTTVSNGTAGQNYTFAATSPVPSTSDQLVYLGYHGDIKSSHGNDDSSHSKRSSTRSTSDSNSKWKDPKPFTPPRIKIVATDNDSILKKKTSSTKVDKIDSIKPPKIHNTKTTSDDSSTSKKKATSSTSTGRTNPNDDSSDRTSSSHKSRSSSNIENDIPSVIIKSFNPKHSTDSGSSGEGGDSFFGGDKFFSDEGDDGF
jgi:hypothetical protein